MKTTDEILKYVCRCIGYIYHHRPIMYGGTGVGVYVLLDAYHELWAEIVGRQDEFRQVKRKVYEQGGSGAHNFASLFESRHPNATQHEIAAYVVLCYRQISDQLGMDIPHAEILQELAEDQQRASDGPTE